MYKEQVKGWSRIRPPLIISSRGIHYIPAMTSGVGWWQVNTIPPVTWPLVVQPGWVALLRSCQGMQDSLPKRWVNPWPTLDLLFLNSFNEFFQPHLPTSQSFQCSAIQGYLGKDRNTFIHLEQKMLNILSVAMKSMNFKCMDFNFAADFGLLLFSAFGKAESANNLTNG